MSTSHNTVLHLYNEFYNIFKYFMDKSIHVFTYAVLMSSNSLKMIKTDQNMSEFWGIVCKNIILTSVHLFMIKIFY
jgi:hypothetical protein